MKEIDKQRLCSALMGVVELQPSLDPAKSLEALQRQQSLKEADVPRMLDRVETVKKHLYEASQLRTMMWVEKALNKEELFRLAYVPFVIAELVWDYADTIINTASRLDARETRSISRMIRQLKNRYDRIRFHFIGPEERAREMANAEIFEQMINGHVRQMMLHIGLELDTETPNLLPDWRTMFKAVYQCSVLSESLMIYTRQQEIKVSRRIGRRIHHILPPECYALHELVPEYFGDMPPTPRLRATLSQYARTFAAEMGRMGYN